MKKLVRGSVVFLAAVLVGACANTAPKAAAATVNTRCVLSGEALTADSPTVDFRGSKVGFCCDKCVAKWNGMDDAGRQAALDKQK